MQAKENPYLSPRADDLLAPDIPFDSGSRALRFATLRPLQTPAIGYLVLSIITLAILSWTVINITAFPLELSSANLVSLRRHLRWYWLLYWPLFFIVFAHCFLASLCMLHGRNRNLCLISCLFSLVPICGAIFPFGVPFAIWILSLLRRQEVADAFLPNPRHFSSRDRALRRLFWPAAILLMGEVMMAVGLIAPFTIDLVWTVNSNTSQFVRHLTNLSRDFIGPLVSTLAFFLLTYCAVQMLRGRQYIACIVGASFAMIPLITPLFILGVPFGIWAFVILLQKETRAAFAEPN